METVRNTADVKQSNIRLIREALFASPFVTKKEIAESVGLSLATCTVLLSEMISSGQVLELPAALSSGGRPARQFSLNGDYAHILCIFLNNDTTPPTIRYRVCDMYGKTLAQGIVIFEVIAIESIKKLIARQLGIFPLICMVGIGIPGITDKNDIVEICDFDCLRGINIKREIEDEFSLNAVVGNDMYFTSYGFYLNSTKEKPFSISVSLWPENRCAGAGSIIDGHVVLGNTGFAGEISNLPYADYKDYKKHPNEKAIDAELIALTATYATCITAILNPSIIYFVGRSTESITAEDIKNWCVKYVPENHLPELVIQAEFENEYLLGIFHFTRLEMIYKN